MNSLALVHVLLAATMVRLLGPGPVAKHRDTIKRKNTTQPNVCQASGIASISVPFAQGPLANYGINLAVFIKGKGQYLFQLDTGSTWTQITADLANTLRLNRGNQRSITSTTTGVKLSATNVRLDRLSIGPTLKLNLTSVAFTPPTYWPFSGLIGIELEDQFVTKLDFNKRLVVFTPPTVFRYVGAAIPLELKRTAYNTPTVEAIIDGVHVRLIIDSGMYSSIQLNSRFVKLLAYEHRSIIPSGVGDLGGGRPAICLRLKSLAIGNLFLLGVPAKIVLAPKDDLEDADGLIGLDVLRHFNVTIDGSRNLAYFEKGNKFLEPFVGNGTGMLVTNDLRVWWVGKGTPASKGGVQEGDRIVSINGQSILPSDSWRLDELSRAPDGTKLSLTLARGKDDIKATIVTRDILGK